MFRFFILPLEIPDKKLHPQKLYKTVLHLLEFLRPRLLEIPHDFFLITPVSFMFFLINPWKLYLLFLQYFWKLRILNPPTCLVFFWNSPMENAFIIYETPPPTQHNLIDSPPIQNNLPIIFAQRSLSPMKILCVGISNSTNLYFRSFCF